MRRREFVTLLGGAAAAWPLTAGAQQAPAPMRRVGMLMGTSENDPESPERIAAFREVLGKLGWSEGRNLAIDFRWGGGNPLRMRDLAKELIAARPDIVVAESTPATEALRQESSTTPIVFFAVANPIGSGFVTSLPRPGGNITGFTNLEASMGGKWLELLKEVAPRIVRAAAIFNPQTHSGQYWPAIEAAGPLLAVEFAKAPIQSAAEIENVFVALAKKANAGLVVMPDTFTLAQRGLIVALSAQYRLPSIYAFRVFARSGGLISYGNDLVEGYRNAASYVDRILRGERPSDLPVQAPTKLQLVINLKTAKALGLEVPQTLLVRADEVIE